jgi:S-adenosylmethionine:tRNA ribosyltransferase-isomerase
MLVMNRKSKTLEHRRFYDILDYLLPGDLLVVNNTRVIPARIFGKKQSGARIEVLLHEKKEKTGEIWEAFLRPAKRIKEGSQIQFAEGLSAVCKKVNEDGTRELEFDNFDKRGFHDILAKIGELPLPPYIKQRVEKPESYQTVYSQFEGAVAAPTAGLHFTKEMLEKVKEHGVEICEVTLHVGGGTFKPVKTENIEDHNIHGERFFVSAKATEKIFTAKESRRRVVAVGTTSMRVLESLHLFEKDENGAYEGETRIYIYPPYTFKMCDLILTNFHLPKSSLIILISAFAGREFVMASYKEAVMEKYRFFSFGDCCLII